MNSSLFEIISVGVTFVIAISLHEYAHAWMSDRLGDPTPRLQGRLTPNPIVHIDPLGFALIFIISFGRGKPVRTDPSYYRHRLRDELLVALIGPATNILLGTIAALIVMVLIKLQGVQIYLADQSLVVQFWYTFGWINMGLAVFNLIPLPPLDGHRIIKYLSPSAGYWLERHSRTIGIIALVLLLVPTPARDLIQGVIVSGAQGLHGLVQTMWGFLLWRR